MRQLASVHLLIYKKIVDVMEVTKTQKNNSKILHGGFAYVSTHKVLKDGWVSYECELRRRYRGCTGRVRVKDDTVLITNPHSHAPNPAQNETIKTVVAMKDRAQHTLDTPQQILGNTLAGVQDAVAAQLPTLNSCRRNIRRQRKAAGNILAVPASRATLPSPLPQEFTTTNAGLPFLRYDSGDQDRILLFGTDEKLNVLENNENWYIDGTFDSVPLIYTQLFTIHARVQGKVIPCIYVLLPNKTEVSYTSALRELFRMKPTLNPSTVLIDFELAIKNGLESVFPGADIYFCFFHFCQNIWRKIQANGLQQRYQDDFDFVTQVRMIAALAFVPGNDVDRVFALLSNNLDQDLDPILDYIEENYIGVIRRGRFRRPRFAYAMWGVYDRVMNDLARTNNAVEGWHNRFNRHVGCHHADIWKLIGVLKKEDDLSRVDLVHIRQGLNVADRNPVYT